MIILNKNESFDKLIKNNNLTIIQFGSDSCGPCFSIKNKIDEWLKKHPNVDNRYIPIELFPEIAAQHDVFGVPSTIVYYGGKEVVRGSRYYSLEEIFLKCERLEFMI
ncbi:Thioredoxin [Lachnospiraceae bacterium C7]|nr:Thioredoxin [Lachnospiraceae bacterium C7]